jgi:hypothetical protein
MPHIGIQILPMNAQISHLFSKAGFAKLGGGLGGGLGDGLGTVSVTVSVEVSVTASGTAKRKTNGPPGGRAAYYRL